MSGEDHFFHGREDPDVSVAIRTRDRNDKGSLREVEFARDPLHRIASKIAGIWEDGERIAFQVRLRENIDYAITMGFVRIQSSYLTRSYRT
jgi:hypothetical protein